MMMMKQAYESIKEIKKWKLVWFEKIKESSEMKCGLWVLVERDIRIKNKRKENVFLWKQQTQKTHDTGNGNLTKRTYLV